MSTVSTATYTLTCMGAGGSTAQSVTVTVASGPAQLTLTWVDNAAGAAFFKVERKAGAAGTYAQLATTGAGVTEYLDTTPVTGTTYCYRVRASNAGGDSGYSNEACKTP
ncbi:MAG: fibronectin type III domain-containing protein [Candidatus Rokuibacteriota bacterium]